MALTPLFTGDAGSMDSALVRHLIRDTNCEVVHVDAQMYAGDLGSAAEALDDYLLDQTDTEVLT